MTIILLSSYKAKFAKIFYTDYTKSMSEHEGASPSQAETVKPKEIERVSSERVALTTRLLLGSDALNPQKTDIGEIKNEQLTLSDDTVNKVKKLSDTERTDYWKKQPEKEFDKQKAAWAEQVKASLIKKLEVTAENKREEVKNVYKKMGIEGEITTDKLLHFYDTYFVGPNKSSDIKKFYLYVATEYVDENEKVDYAALQKDMEIISWFSNVFGANTSKLIPSLIEADLISSNNKELKDELIRKANEKKSGDTTTRVNNPNDKEKPLLKLLFDISPVTENTPAPPEKTEEKNSVIPVSQKDIDQYANLPSQIKTPEGKRLTYKEVVDQLLDLTTGDFRTEGISLKEDFQKELAYLKTQLADVRSKELTKKASALILTPALLQMIDQIAARANEVNKELGFSIRGTATKQGENYAMLGAVAIPDNDYSKAINDSTIPDMPKHTKRFTELEEKTGLKEAYGKEPSPGDGRNHLIQVHIHQLGLHGKNIDTPSETDLQAEKKILDDYVVGQRFYWGIATKMEDGSLRMSFFESTKDKDGKIERKLMTTIPFTYNRIEKA